MLSELTPCKRAIRNLAPGERLFSEGDPGDRAYYVESGVIDIVVERSGEHVHIARRSEGTIVGEMAVIDGGRRTATVIAVTACRLVEVTHAQLLGRISELDPVSRHLLESVLDRCRQTILRVSKDKTLANEVNEGCHGVGQEALATIKLENELSEAIDREELAVYLQPIVRLQPYHLEGYEALLRWRHPERGLVPPDQFIPHAERSGLITRLTAWVLRQACRQIKELSGSGNSATISINVSARDLAEPSFVDLVKKTLSDTNVAANALKLEVTESALMQDPERAANILQQCREFGTSIAIDDFGTGYSSFAYLSRYPCQSLKIDHSFINGITEDSRQAQIVRSMIELGRTLGMSVVAEGVETTAQHFALVEMGCNSAQGYLYGHPQPIERSRQWQIPNLADRRDYDSVQPSLSNQFELTQTDMVLSLFEHSN